MELTDLLHALRKMWLLVVVALLLGAGAGFAASALSTKAYAATTGLYVSVQGTESTTAGEIAQGSSAAQLKVRSYVDVVTSARVLQPVIDELHLDLTPRQLAGRVTATYPANTVLLYVTVVDTSPKRTADIANAIGKNFRSVVQTGLEAHTTSGPPAVTIETINPATVPAVPASPNVRLDVIIGGIIGLVVGLVAAVLLHQFDTKIRSPRDVISLGGAPVVGATAFDPNAERNRLVVHHDPRSPRAEAFRSLRTNIQFLQLDSPQRCFVLSSSMPAEGKTTTVCNLAVALAESGLRVALVDADLRRPRLAEAMGLEGAAGLTDVLIGRAELDDVVQPWGRGSLSVLPAGQVPPNPSELLGSESMRAVIDELNTTFDVVLIDAPPLLPVTDAAILSKLTTGTLLVAAANKTKRGQFKAAVAALDRVGTRVVGVIVTMVPSKARPGSYGEYGAYGSYGSYYGDDVGRVGDGDVATSSRRGSRNSSSRIQRRRKSSD